MDRRRIVGIDGGPAGPPQPSKEDIEIAKYVGMSQWYEKYAELLSKSDIDMVESRTKAAYREASDYLRKAIDIVERQSPFERK